VVPVPETLPVQSRPVVPDTVAAEKVIAVPAHFGPFWVGAAGVPGVGITVPVTAVREADTQFVVVLRDWA
jgi:hypothetical protein